MDPFHYIYFPVFAELEQSYKAVLSQTVNLIKSSNKKELYLCYVLLTAGQFTPELNSIEVPQLVVESKDMCKDLLSRWSNQLDIHVIRYLLEAFRAKRKTLKLYDALRNHSKVMKLVSDKCLPWFNEKLTMRAEYDDCVHMTVQISLELKDFKYQRLFQLKNYFCQHLKVTPILFLGFKERFLFFQLSTNVAAGLAGTIVSHLPVLKTFHVEKVTVCKYFEANVQDGSFKSLVNQTLITPKPSVKAFRKQISIPKENLLLNSTTWKFGSNEQLHAKLAVNIGNQTSHYNSKEDVADIEVVPDVSKAPSSCTPEELEAVLDSDSNKKASSFIKRVKKTSKRITSSLKDQLKLMTLAPYLEIDRTNKISRNERSIGSDPIMDTFRQLKLKDRPTRDLCCGFPLVTRKLLKIVWLIFTLIVIIVGLSVLESCGSIQSFGIYLITQGLLFLTFLICTSAANRIILWLQTKRLVGILILMTFQLFLVAWLVYAHVSLAQPIKAGICTMTKTEVSDHEAKVMVNVTSTGASMDELCGLGLQGCNPTTLVFVLLVFSVAHMVALAIVVFSVCMCTCILYGKRRQNFYQLDTINP